MVCTIEYWDFPVNFTLKKKYPQGATTLQPAAVADLRAPLLVGLHGGDLRSAACGLCQRTCQGGRVVTSAEKPVTPCVDGLRS